jgi:hypothetical protein
MERELALEKAIVHTVTYCKEHGILKEFLENLSPEEVNMVAAEWNMPCASVRKKTYREAVRKKNGKS